MAVIFEYLVLKSASDIEVQNAGLNGWMIVLFKGSDAWFVRETITP